MLSAKLASSDGDERVAALLQLGTLEENTGNLTQALVHFRAAQAQAQPGTRLRDSANLMSGMAAARQREYDAAIESLSLVLQHRKDAARLGGFLVAWDTHATLGVAFAETGRFAEASAQFDLAAKATEPGRATTTQATLVAWKRAADSALQQGRAPTKDFFWTTAYGSDAALTAQSRHYELVPIVRVVPRYPPEAARRNLGGHVYAEVSIDEKGKPTRIRIVESSPTGLFDHAAVSALSQWKFQPHIQDCRPVAFTGGQRIEFRLQSN